MSENNYTRMTISFTEADKDIIKYLDELKKSGKASEFVRDAIREKMLRDKNVKDENLEEKIRRIVEEVLAEHQSSPPQLNKTNQDNDLNDAVLNAINSFDF